MLNHNKLLTGDNRVKRQHVSDMNCLLCAEQESVTQLCFECAIATLCWSDLLMILQTDQGLNFEHVATCWLSNVKFAITNMLCTTMMWSLWKHHNDLHVCKTTWLGMQTICRKLVCMVRNWRSLYPEKERSGLDDALLKLEMKAREQTLLGSY